jgi:Carboxypeptidase regulatory-like domain
MGMGMSVLLCSLLVGLVVGARADVPMAKLTIRVLNDSNRPIDRASVIVRFVEGRAYLKFGKKIRDTYELRTNQEGEATIPEIPQGKILIQVIAHGYQTFGQTFDVKEEERTFEIKLLPPQKQYSTYEKK